MKNKKETDSAARKFGAFGGVFTPSVLTILGVILFLRYDTVVGNAGLWGVLLILMIAKGFTTITTFSLSSIATNMKVKGGGSYFLISRSLGVEFGGVIAVFFYIALALSVSIYVIGFTFIVYAGIAVLMAASTSRISLVGDGMVMQEKAWFGPLVYAGVIAATLSSALGSMMGAPRILQAFAKDNIFKGIKYYAQGSGTSNEPRRAIVITFIFAQLGVLVGDLDSVAPIITMFFLLTYGTINLASFFESISANPSFRPTFRFNHWSVSLLGALASLAIMFLINWVWASIAIVIAASLFVGIKRSELIVQWGDVLSGYAYQRARNALLALEKEKYYPKNWRPSILSLSGIAGNRMHLVKYANLLSAGRGLISLAQIISGDLETLHKRRTEAEKLLHEFIRKEELPAFPVVVVDENISDGLKALLQCHGIGGLRPNIVLLGWSNDPEKKNPFHLFLA